MTRGESFDNLDSKSDDLRNASQNLKYKAKKVRMQGEAANSIATMAIFACMMLLFVILYR